MVGFTSPFNFVNRDPTTLVELRMRRFSGKIRSKPDWWEKVNDPAIVEKWRAEIVEQDRELVDRLWGGEERFIYRDGGKKWPREPITQAQVDYIFDELKYEASRRDPETGIFATSIPKVYESRSLIPSELKAELVQAASPLEDVPEEKKDWHPGSNKQVLDLVHPSLYCLVVDESYVRKADASDGDPVEVITQQAYTDRRPDMADFIRWGQTYFISQKYQWLPTDFAVSDSGAVEPLGYINNLHPLRDAALYAPITSILARFIPMFERVLSDVRSPERPAAIQVDPFEWYNGVTPECPGYDDDEVYEAWEEEHRWPIIPDPAPFTAPTLENRVEYPLKGRKVQVIVKLANIVLTPENPRYAGGAWHVEGMANENIVATGLYYYACENITESRLDFRGTAGTADGIDMRYEQSDNRGYIVAYGFGRDHHKNQELGHIVAEEDKCVAFPNIYQHHVDAFELADPTKPGYRKILCFFLVNPETEILSTTHVPPQQEDWAMDEVEKAPALQKLPVELFRMVTEYVKPGVMSREKAEAHRADLMKERSGFVVQHNERVYEIEFNMCEH
ncbi:hypothetical protein OH76DRAFT_1407017 [Lentinus brumalis]|uniref:Uncharacterized protein n=1 Tax=Lentinus brumalis TaxID=2498619 RepID=A0A371D1A1_9APHY|nr:hypothetical protein OH76DRAFT_1407017 [Polyporus brumalis]